MWDNDRDGNHREVNEKDLRELAVSIADTANFPGSISISPGKLEPFLLVAAEDSLPFREEYDGTKTFSLGGDSAKAFNSRINAALHFCIIDELCALGYAALTVDANGNFAVYPTPAGRRHAPEELAATFGRGD
jgi:hypothetical protein